MKPPQPPKREQPKPIKVYYDRTLKHKVKRYEAGNSARLLESKYEGLDPWINKEEY